VRVLVTGGSGFIGRRVVARLVERGDEVVTLQRRITGPVPRVTALALDVAALETGQLPGRFDAVVHLAARLDNPFGRDYALADLADTNVGGTMRLLEAAAAAGVRRFIHGSTGGVGSNPPAGGRMKEDDAPRPVNPYGLTKHLAEQAVRVYAWPFERVSLRYFAPYARDASNPMFQHVLACLDRGEPIDVGLGGGPELNPIHVDDAASATVTALDAADLPDVINIAGADVTSLAGLAEQLGRAIGRTPVIRERAEPALSWVADIERLCLYLGRPMVGLEEGIRSEFGGSRDAAFSPDR
jgi:nucleoside-diphosphate-sugar epimerase